MSAIQFVHPWYLLGLILVPLMVVWYIWHYRKQEPALQHSDIAVFDGIGKSLRVRLRWLPYALRVLAVAAMVVALARPQSRLSRQEMKVCGLLIELERNNKIGLEIAAELSGHDDGIVAVGALGSSRCFIGYDFAAAGLAFIDAQIFRLTLLPVAARFGFPVHFGFRSVCFQLFIIGLECFEVIFRETEGAFHLLRCTVEFDLTAAAGAFIFNQISHWLIPHFCINQNRAGESSRPVFGAELLYVVLVEEIAALRADRTCRTVTT